MNMIELIQKEMNNQGEARFTDKVYSPKQLNEIHNAIEASNNPNIKLKEVVREATEDWQWALYRETNCVIPQGSIRWMTIVLDVI